jgi:hypothetical protein
MAEYRQIYLKLNNYCKFRNKQYQLDTHFTFHFIEVHGLDMFRALIAHPQEALHKRRVGDCCVRL